MEGSPCIFLKFGRHSNDSCDSWIIDRFSREHFLGGHSEVDRVYTLVYLND